MREIKFRGKRIDNGEWIEGAYIYNNNLPFIISHDVIDYDEEYIAPVFWWRVDPKTVGQYTGLKDKNGTEIYEGDIVWCRAGEHAWGTWEYEKQFTVEYGWTQEMWEMMQAHEIEVIGNIHDNPELLGGAE